VEHKLARVAFDSKILIIRSVTPLVLYSACTEGCISDCVEIKHAA
jgi:hypothetical protein